MNDVILSILFIILGLFVGIIIMIILNYIKNNLSGKKAESIIDKANKEADKIKNIYDLGNNLYEWTAEANYTDVRVLRGR